ncbi:unnamed protein product [Meloidogyne enterolobii]|uniref:Uncharacterized protein n=1 Tax=Meloidogyne enterolobii TaxID=390850 RepID=A0ACB0Y9W9_MELEN
MQIIDETNELKEIKENNHENDLIKDDNDDIISSDEDEQKGEIEELELRKRLFSNKIIPEIVNNKDEQKIDSDIEIKENNEEIYENNEENEGNKDSESINLIKEELSALNEENPSSESRLVLNYFLFIKILFTVKYLNQKIFNHRNHYLIILLKKI